MRFVLPDFMNLGIAPPPPRGATALAPRCALVPPATLGTPFVKRYRATEPLALLPRTVGINAVQLGAPFTATRLSPLTPNPYTGGSSD
jgi:hypothetical protein